MKMPLPQESVRLGPGQYHLAVAGGCAAVRQLLNHVQLAHRCGHFAWTGLSCSTAAH